MDELIGFNELSNEELSLTDGGFFWAVGWAGLLVPGIVALGVYMGYQEAANQ